MHLTTYDISFCVRRIPKELKKLMQREGEKVIIAGGFIRSIIANETVSDIDVFAGGKETSTDLAMQLAGGYKCLYSTDNAITVTCYTPAIQFIHRWTYESFIELIKSFDFTICQACIWYDTTAKKWASACSDRFYQDLASKRLSYTLPERNEDAGGSLLRVLKYYQRGYRIPLDSFGAVLARLLIAVRDANEMSEDQMIRVITGLLFEVDPAGFIDHEAYLPSETEIEKETTNESN